MEPDIKNSALYVEPLLDNPGKKRNTGKEKDPEPDAMTSCAA
jgi:hypothetical protein